MKGVFFISRRLSAKSGLAVVSVAISAVVMLIALFVSSGFRSAIQGSISAVSGDMAVLSPYMDIMSEKHYVRCTDEYKDLIGGCPGVKRVSPSIYRAGIVKSGTGISGVVFKGVDSTYDFSMLSGRLVEGSFPVLRKGRISTEAAIPLSLAQEAGVGLGDTFLAYFIGEEVKARYREQVAKCSSRFLLRAMKLCNDCDLNYKGSRNKRLQVELTLIMIAQQDDADDDVGSGRGPAQRLKPIANDKKPADAGAAAPVSRQEQQVAPQAQPEHRPQAAAVTTAAAPTAVKAGAKDDGTAAPVMSSRKMGISIKKAARSLSYAETAETAAGQTVEDVQEPLADGGAAAVEDVTEEELNICWRSFALQLPVEDSALSGRMRNMHLAKQGKASFEVTVDNEMVRDSLLHRREHILAFMQRQLHVSPLLMTVKVSDVAQKKIPVSRMEKYAEMCKTNAALKDFQQMFGLEFD